MRWTGAYLSRLGCCWGWCFCVYILFTWIRVEFDNWNEATPTEVWKRRSTDKYLQRNGLWFDLQLWWETEYLCQYELDSFFLIKQCFHLTVEYKSLMPTLDGSWLMLPLCITFGITILKRSQDWYDSSQAVLPSYGRNISHLWVGF